MPVVECLAHGHVEADAQGADEVGVLVAVEEEAMYYFYLFASAVEVEAHNERQPFAPRFVLVHAFQLDEGTHVSGTFGGD